MNPLPTSVNFAIEAPVGGFYYVGVIGGRNETIVHLPSSVAVFQNERDFKGVYLRTDNDAVTAIGQNELNSYSDTFLILPYKRSNVKTEYVYYGISVAGYTSSYQSAILIVGTEDNTTMKLTVTQTATTNTGNTLYTGREYSFVINRLQTFNIRSTGDLSGTKIVTNKQVSVFSGHELAQIPDDVCCGDQLIEQVPPVTSWGRVFYTMPLATRRSYTIRLLAAYNLTEIDLYCKKLDEPYIINEESHTISEGEYYVKTFFQQEYCIVHSNKPILVAQFSHGGYEEGDFIGDPMMMIISDTLQFSNHIFVTTIRNATQSGYSHYVNIIVLAQYFQPDMIHLFSGGKNISLNTQDWVPMKVKFTAEAYAAQVNISEGVAEFFLTNKAALMAAVTYGFTRQKSYGHSGRVTFVTGWFNVTCKSNCNNVI